MAGRAPGRTRTGPFFCSCIARGKGALPMSSPPGTARAPFTPLPAVWGGSYFFALTMPVKLVPLSLQRVSHRARSWDTFPRTLGGSRPARPAGAESVHLPPVFHDRKFSVRKHRNRPKPVAAKLLLSKERRIRPSVHLPTTSGHRPSGVRMLGNGRFSSHFRRFFYHQVASRGFWRSQ